MPLFDRIVVVDWSASARPALGADSIWVADLEVATGAVDVVNHPTRAIAREALVAIALQRERTLIGFDFPLGYPRGTAASAGLDGTPWEAMWHHLASRIVDDDRNRSNRFEVAADLNRRMAARRFWGAPAARTNEWLTRTKAKPFPEPDKRLTEQRMRFPSTAWQLLGVGSVGSQSLTGIPVAHHLRTHADLRGVTRVWPFETGLRTPAAVPGEHSVVLTEVWPSMVPCGQVSHEIKDARQVIALARWFADLDRRGELAALFTPQVDADAAVDVVVDEEGWVLGVP